MIAFKKKTFSRTTTTVRGNDPNTILKYCGQTRGQNLGLRVSGLGHCYIIVGVGGELYRDNGKEHGSYYLGLRG